MNKILNNKTMIIIMSSICTVLLVTGVLLYLLFFKERFVFKLIGDKKVSLGVYESYNELGVKAYINKKDVSSDVVIDISSVDINKLGTYEVTYKIVYKDKEYTLTRKVEVIDDMPPIINLIGEKEIIIKQGNDYQEHGCTAVDNYDEKINDKVQITNYVNTNDIGLQTVSYFVVDDSGNSSSITRKVIVVPKEFSSNEVDYLDLMDSNRVTSMSYIDDGIHIEGYVKDNNGKFNIKLCGDDKSKCKNYEMNKIDDYYYSGNIKLSNLNNGTYYMWVVSKTNEKVVNALPTQYRISRAKIGEKLVAFSYDNNNIKVKVEDFEYLYDIVIDPGHGGSDPGAANSITNENYLNLMQSLYEKERYEEHGLKVLLLRDDYSYGIVMGDEAWPAVRRKAYALGYYGSVSKITYSNHHNSSEDKSLTGWEIIASSNAIDDDLKEVYEIRDNWSKIYNLSENHIRIYTRNYNTGTIFTKENNEKYYFTDYYAVIRLPYQLFNIKNILYEGSYLSNYNDFDWYYNNENWKKLSEEKIKTYVNLLGINYISPK